MPLELEPQENHHYDSNSGPQINIDGHLIELGNSLSYLPETYSIIDSENRKYQISYDSGIIYITSGPAGQPCSKCNGSGVEP